MSSKENEPDISQEEEASATGENTEQENCESPDHSEANATVATGEETQTLAEEEEEIEFDLEAQIEVFRQQVEEEPENCVHHYNLGEALEELGNHEEAKAEFELALGCDHDKGFSSIIHFGLGSLYYYQLMHGTSANVVLSSVGLHSSHSDKVNITEVHDAEYKLPIDQFEAAIKNLPYLKADEEIYDDISTNAPLNIANTHYKWGSDLIDKARQLNKYGDEIEDVKRAQKYLKKTLKIDPNNSAAALLVNVSQKMLAQGWKTYDEYGFEAKDIPGIG